MIQNKPRMSVILLIKTPKKLKKRNNGQNVERKKTDYTFIIF